MKRHNISGGVALLLAAGLAYASGLPEEYHPPRETPKVEMPKVEKGLTTKPAPGLHDVSVTFAVGGVAEDELAAATDKMAAVLERRAVGLAQSYDVTPDAEHIGRIRVDLKGCAEPDRALAILLTPGRLEFQAVATKAELTALAASAGWAADRFIASDHASLLLVPAGDKAAFAADVARVLPAGQRIVWSREVAYDGRPVYKVGLATGDGMAVTGSIKAAAVAAENGAPRVDFELGPADGVNFSGLTGRHVGEAIAVIFDDEVLYTARVQEQAFEYVTIFGDLDEARASEIALVLNSGSLPAVLTPLEYAVDGKSRPLPAGRR